MMRISEVRPLGMSEHQDAMRDEIGAIVVECRGDGSLLYSQGPIAFI